VRRTAAAWCAAVGATLACVAPFVSAAAVPRPVAPAAVDWPTTTPDSRPWARWWWLGSAVDEDGLTRQLDELARAGFGGV
jgi:hypothetical protein